MKLGEVALDSHIAVAVIKGDTSVNLDTTVIEVTDEALYVEPFRHGESIISFNLKEGMHVEMLALRPGEVPNFWNSVLVTKGEYKERVCHIITTSVNGVRLNRRNSFRVFVGLEGTCMEQAGGVKYDVTVRDISSTGIGIMVSGENAPDFKISTPVHITYTDGECRFSIDVEGRVVRKEEIEDGPIIYGCKFVRLYPQIDRYVTQKQIKNRHKKVPLV